MLAIKSLCLIKLKFESSCRAHMTCQTSILSHICSVCISSGCFFLTFHPVGVVFRPIRETTHTRTMSSPPQTSYPSFEDMFAKHPSLCSLKATLLHRSVEILWETLWYSSVNEYTNTTLHVVPLKPKDAAKDQHVLSIALSNYMNNSWNPMYSSIS